AGRWGGAGRGGGGHQVVAGRESSSACERRAGPRARRRKFLGAAGAVAAGLAAGPLLEACGGGTAQPGATPKAAVPTPRSGASIRLLQWVHFVPAADTEFVRQANEFGDKFG